MASARRFARRLERSCWACAKYFPLVFVYGLTTWAVAVLVSLCSSQTKVSWLGALPCFPIPPFPSLLTPFPCPGKAAATFGTALYLLANWSYTTAVFTPPGSTTNDNGYSTLPTHAAPSTTSFTVKSNGELRFCKKCQARKPDRAHHCSTCRRCVLKMDHHCPWLATCVGLRNQKAFLLFLIYTTLFSLFCFAASGAWVWEELFVPNTAYVESLLPVNYIILCVISGIIGLVIGAFTGWHIYLAVRGQTTIECLEKTRYLSPLRRTMHQTYINQHTPGQGVALPSYGQQLLDLHQNALPGITRPEEGEELRPDPSHTPQRYASESASPAAGPHRGPQLQAGSRRFTYDEMERHRARLRHEEYLDEQDSTRLPNAFDLGPRRNLLHLFGSNPWMWPWPVCTTSGDGWSWEANPRWLEARERLARERAEQAERERMAGWGAGPDDSSSVASPVTPGFSGGAGRHYLQPQTTHYNNTNRANGSLSSPLPSPGRKSPSKADRILGRDPNLYADQHSGGGRGEAVSMKRLSPAGRTIEDELDEIDRQDDYDEDDDDDDDDSKGGDHRDADKPQQQQQEQRADAERRAMSVVTNGRWGRGGDASALLRGPGSPGLARVGGDHQGHHHGGGSGGGDDDDGVD
jgi:palmitoyltransferase